MEIYDLHGEKKVIRIPKKHAKQMFNVPGHPEFSQEPTNDQLEKLWLLVHTSYDTNSHVLHPDCPRHVKIKPPSHATLRKLYRRQPVLKERIRVVREEVQIQQLNRRGPVEALAPLRQEIPSSLAIDGANKGSNVFSAFKAAGFGRK
jgi:hypothetical protein